MNPSIVNISNGPHELNVAALENIDVNRLSLNVTSRLRYSKDSDYVGFQIDLMVMQDTIQVFRSGFLVGLAISDWAKDLRDGLDLNENREKIKEISKTVWLVATGIVAVQSSTAQFNGIVLPAINYEDFSKEVILVPNTP